MTCEDFGQDGGRGKTALWLARALNMVLLAVKYGSYEIRSKLIKMHLESCRFVSRSMNYPDIAVLQSMSFLDSLKRPKLASRAQWN